MASASITRNATYNLMGSVLPLLATLVTTPLYLHSIGESRYGVLAIVWLLLGYFGVFDMGLSRATSNHIAKLRHGPQTEKQAIFWTALSLNLVFGLVGAILLWIAGSYLLTYSIKMPADIRQEALSALPWVAGAVPVITMTGVFSGVLEGEEKFLSINIVRSAGSLAFAVVPLLVALTSGPSLAALIPVAVLVRIFFALPLFGFAVRSLQCKAPQRPRADWVRRLLGYGAWVMVTNFVGPVLEAADRLIMGSLLGVKAVAAYSVPFNLADRARLLPGALARALFPRMASLYGDNARALAADAIRSMGKLMAPLIALGIFAMQPFLTLWISSSFALRSAPVGEIILLGIWINSLAFIPFALLQSNGRPDVVAKFHLIELLPFLGILWLGIRWFGLEGAAWAWTLRVTVDALLLFWASGMMGAALSALWPAALSLGLAWLIAAIDSVSPWVKLLLALGLLFSQVLWLWSTEPSIQAKVRALMTAARQAVRKRSSDEASAP